jgi:hypothetical protein
VLLRHTGLGEVEYSIFIRHEFHGFVDRVEFNGIVEEEKIRLVTGVSFHLADQRLLLLPIHGAEDLRIEPLEFRLLDDPIVRTVEREQVIGLNSREIHLIIKKRQRDILSLLLGRLIQVGEPRLLIIDRRVE